MIDMQRVRNQEQAIAVVETAIVEGVGPSLGFPGILLSGPPGTGKTAIAEAVVTIMPPLPDLEHNRAWLLAEHEGADPERRGLPTRPFRAPHHSISREGLVGSALRPSQKMCWCREAYPRHGGPHDRGAAAPHLLPSAAVPPAGELQRARFGVLFLDELRSFNFGVIEALGQKLRGMRPEARPMVIASTNPCPCGWRGSSAAECKCDPDQLERFSSALARNVSSLGIRITADVKPVPRDLVAIGETSAAILARIEARIARR